MPITAVSLSGTVLVRQVSGYGFFAEGYGLINFLPDPTIYAVSSSLAELHLEDVGLQVEWHDVLIPESMREEVWKGVRRRYWDLPGYRLPIAKMGLN